MFPFARELARSWVRPRLGALGWYYGRRLHLTRKGEVRLTIDSRVAGRPSRSIVWKTANDARETLRTFSDRNPWEQYPLPETVGRIVDLGAHLGLTTLYWSIRYPAARLEAVEMDADNAARCRELFAANGLNARLTQVAIAAADGPIAYTRHDSDSRHRLDALGDEFSGLTGAAGSAEGVSFATLLDRIGGDRIDILKVDIEGAEEYLLRSIGEWGQRVRVMLLELHHNIVYDEAVSAVRAAGFEIVGEDRQNRTELCCRRP